MAEKRSKSLLGGLKNMLHLDSEKPSKSSSKPAASTRKKPAAAEAPPAQKAKNEVTDSAAPDPAAPKPEKKIQNQPWYRHRQRW
jgi:uncharacterized membrane protein